jgi:thiamine transport system permease protein
LASTRKWKKEGYSVGWRLLDGLSSIRPIQILVYSSAIVFFIALILLPTIFGVIIEWETLSQILEDKALTSRALSAVLASFEVATVVAIIDLVTGLPLAWFIARSRSKYMEILDTLSDMPLIMPTVALGYSLLLFWSNPGASSSPMGGSLVSPGWLLIILLHLTFSYPYIVRTMVGAIKRFDERYELQARTLGASPFTAARSVTLPILKLDIVASFVLAFARSLSETGATIIVAGSFETGPVFIKKAIDSGHEGSMVFAGLTMILLSIAVFVSINLLASRIGLPIRRVYPQVERRISKPRARSSGITLSVIFFFSLIIVPSFFVLSPALEAAFDGTLLQALGAVGPWRGYWDSFLLSFVVAGIASVVNILFGGAVVLIISRRKLGIISRVLENLVNIPLIVPTIALGVSLSIFWREMSVLPIGEFWILTLTHLSFTYPFFIKVMSAAVESIDPDVEDVARTLGARPFTVFRTLIIPLTKYSFFSGIILMFTRSIGETGATLAVVKDLKTVPVLLVDWVGQAQEGVVPLTQPALGALFLILFSFAVMLISRFLLRRGEHRGRS